MLDKKVIEITVSINSGTIDSPVFEEITLKGLRCSVAVLGGTLSGQGQLQCSIHGLTPELMAKLTVTGFIRQENRGNQIMVAAGNDNGVLSIVYTGTILEAFANINQPESTFQIIALSALKSAVIPVAASSYQGSKSVSMIMEDFAKDAGYDFKDEGVKAVLSNSYFTGTVWDKIKRCAAAADILYALNNNTLTIWNDGDEKKEDVIITSDLGNKPLMIGVPKCGGSGLSLSTLFYPSFYFTKKYEVISKDFPLANGLWIPTSIVHTLESETDGGVWLTDIEFKRGV